MSENCTTEELAELFGVAEKTIRAWTHAGMPVEVAGKRGRGVHRTMISLRKAVAWYFAENFERLALDRQRTRFAKAQADKTELENTARRGALVTTCRAFEALAELSKMKAPVDDRAEGRN